ncbi:MAG: AMP-binding protein [Halofilum sp. (in: g-proteobacteria)]|nr:AMP-binding protein [Halofilum sp. (in: g-proteobacteria)]
MHNPISETGGDSSIVGALRERASRCPGALAIDGAHRMSWRVLLADVERCAAELRALDMPVVAWQLDDDWRWVVLDLACLVNGQTALPIPRFFTPAQREGALVAAGCRRLMLGVEAEDRTGPIVRQLRWLGVTVTDSGIAGTGAAIPKGTAKITFTSGSTGKPKGVCLSGSLLESVAEALNARLEGLAVEPHLATLPLAVLLENVGGLYRCLLAGSRYILPPPEQRCVTGSSVFNDERLAEAIMAHAAGMVIATPGMIERMTTSGRRDAFRRLRFVAVGGAPLPERVLRAARAAGMAAYEGYGLSECGSVVSLNVPGDDRPGTVGRPLPHLSVSCRDGELEVAGAGFLGYLGEPPRAMHAVATGDLGHIAADGRLELHGRLGNRIVTPMGRNVSPEWIESALADVLPGHQICVIDDPEGLAAVIAGPGSDASIETALQATNRGLPDYARIAHWLCRRRPFGIDDGCLTTNGRLRRRAIRERFAHHPRQRVRAGEPASRERDPAAVITRRLEA